MRIHRSYPEHGYTIIPNAALQDQRLSMTARGVLVDILSRPDGWQTNADAMVEQAHRMRPEHAEGRRVMRSAYAELEAAGYMVRTRLRGPGGTMRTEIDVYDVPQNAHRGTGTGMSAASSEDARLPSSHRGTAYRPSVGGTSIERQNTKEEENKEVDPASAASSALNADALSRESDDADASSAAGKPSARTNDRSAKAKRPKPPTLDQRLDAHLAALGPGAIDKMYRDLDNDRMGITEWAVKKARKALGLGWVDPEADPGGPLARKAVGLVLMRLTKADGGGLTPTVEDLLGDFDWPDERVPSTYRAGEPSGPRPSPGFLYPHPDDKTHDASRRMVHRAIASMDCLELAAAIEQFEAQRPRIYRKCRKSAAETAAGANTEAVDREILRLGADYYLDEHGKFPKFLIPESIRPTKAAA